MCTSHKPRCADCQRQLSANRYALCTACEAVRLLDALEAREYAERRPVALPAAGFFSAACC